MENKVENNFIKDALYFLILTKKYKLYNIQVFEVTDVRQKTISWALFLVGPYFALHPTDPENIISWCYINNNVI